MSTDAQSGRVKRRRLGKGLSGMIGEPVAVDQSPAEPKPAPAVEPSAKPQPAAKEDVAPAGPAIMIPLSGAIPNRNQPRKSFDEQALKSLAESIQADGLMQPIVVRPASSGGSTGGRYEIIAGERRWRAAKIAGLTHIPAMVREEGDKSSAQLALIENIHREDLNAIERAEALAELATRFAMSHADIAEKLGMDRSSVANLIRLCDLEDEIRTLIAEGHLGLGHGKALLSVIAGDQRIKLAVKAAKEEWSVRQLEAQAKLVGKPTEVKAAAEAPRRSAVHADLERKLGDHLGTKVSIKTNRTGTKGKLVIDFYGIDHFDGLISSLGVGGERV
jgi:ParB family chromosome partitioning protein